MAAITLAIEQEQPTLRLIPDRHNLHDAVHQKSRHGIASGRDATHNKAQMLINERIDWINTETRSSKDVGPFFVADIGDVWRNYENFKAQLPFVEPHFAVKSNPENMILKVLGNAGAGFDCASVPEVEKALEMGASTDKIVWAHPRVNREQLLDARKLGVKHFVFDSEDELDLAATHYPDIKFLVRIAPDDSASTVKLSEKFGAPLPEVEGLLQKAKDLKLDVIGVHFHVGSDNHDPHAFTAAINDARAAFDMGAALGYKFKMLDLGGGYTRETFDDTAAAIRAAIDHHFPAPRQIRVLGEPGRFFVASAFTLATRVIGRRKVRKAASALDLDIPDWKVDISDGIYGSLANLFSDGQKRHPKIFRQQDPSVEDLKYLIWGPTCDSFDKPIPLCTLRGLLSIDDWLLWEDQGAYTIPCATEFNGMPRAKIIWTSTEPAASALLDQAARDLLHAPSMVDSLDHWFPKANL